jgi:probable HAF family extracellular repeat protein
MPAPTFRRRLSTAALGLGFLLTLYGSGLLSPRPAPRYAVTDLGVLPGYAASDAAAVNSRGDVVGSATPKRSGGSWASTGGRAYLSTGGTLTDLGTLPGTGGSIAEGINAQDEVTGSADFPASCHAFLYSKGRMRDLGTLPGFHDSTGVGINDRGEVAVNARSSPMQPGPSQGHVFLYSHERMTNIGLPPGCSEGHALGINNAGQIVGDCHARRIGRTRPFLYDSRTRTMTLLPVPAPYRRGWVNHINDSGQIIGDVFLSNGNCHAVLWHGNQMTDLGTPPGYSVSIGSGLNNQAEAVGYCFDEGSVKAFLRDHVGRSNALGHYLDRDMEHAFVYRGGKIQDLNDLIPQDSDWTLESARGINDRGQIVGQGQHHGRERAFLLTPIR